jgi:hypothetical protein
MPAAPGLHWSINSFWGLFFVYLLTGSEKKFMDLNIFKPAKAGLSQAELEARNKRERLALNALACVLTNAPMPPQQTIATMQRYVDGKITLDEAREIELAASYQQYNVLTPGGKVA